VAQLFEGVYRGAADLRAPIVLPLTLSCQKSKRRGNAKGLTHPTAPRRPLLRRVEIPSQEPGRARSEAKYIVTLRGVDQRECYGEQRPSAG